MNEYLQTQEPTSQVPSLSLRSRQWADASRKRSAAGNVSPRLPNFDHAFFDIHAKKPFWERYARSMAYALENEPVYLFDEELLVGMLYQVSSAPIGFRRDEERWRPFCPWTQAQKRIAQEVDPYMAAGGAPGHVGWRWDMLLEKGIKGHVADIRSLLVQAKDAKARRLYRGALILWESVLRWNDQHVAAMREKVDSVCDPERGHLVRMIEVCSRVPRFPARTFHEAVQSFHLQHLAVMFENPFGGNGPGRLDVLLWPYLEKDLAENRISLGEARDLINELFIRFEERLFPADGWVEAVVVGGCHPDGTSAVNPLSYLMVESIMALDQTHPVVYPRLSRTSPEDFLDLCVRYLLDGKNRAQVYNDEACIPAIVKSGTSSQDAAQYMAGGCMEISAQGMACDLNFAGIHNVSKTLELVLNGGADLLTGARRIPLERCLSDYQHFEDLYRAFEAELIREYQEMVKALDIQSECFARYRPCLLLSSLVKDCLERGREQQDGGARYHEYGFAPLGITAASDSLASIRQAVFEEGLVSGPELLSALRSNYAGHEALRMKLRRIPKFGVEDPQADAMCRRVLSSVCAAAHRPQARFKGQLKPMIFNFVWTPGVSKELGARADGSFAGDMIGQGMTPQGFAMTQGITAAMNSCTSLDFSGVSGGATTMWDMDDSWITFDRMKVLLKVFLARGGMIFQGNTTSVKDLERAFESPAEYSNLIVRVGGFSARFVSLDREVQREIIHRRRHAI